MATGYSERGNIHNILLGKEKFLVEGYKRYRQLRESYPFQKKFPHFLDFDLKTLPLRDEYGSLVFERGLSITRRAGERIWKESTKRLTAKERDDFQVVFVPNSHHQNGDHDFSNSFYEDLTKEPVGKNPVAVFKRGVHYGGDTHENERKVENMVNVKSVYIVASPLDDQDMTEIEDIANQYLNNGALEVNLIAPFMPNEREDKNIAKKNKPEDPVMYNARIIKLQSRMRALGSVINRLVTFEPHSYATQAFAACSGIALAPMSLEEELIGQIKGDIEKDSPDNWRVVRPDIGRNLVATRIEDRFKIKGIHLKQIRNSETLVKQAEILTENETRELRGKNTILYDDEGGTLGTIKNVVLQHLVPSGVSSINIFLGHARLQTGWEANLDEMVHAAQKQGIPLKFYTTDSRVPVGKLNDFMKEHPGAIEIVSVAKKTRKVIEAMVGGVNFWRDKNGVDWERSILQAINRYDKKEFDSDD